MIRFFHPDDPHRGPYQWPFVYLHGPAEDINQRMAEANGWEDLAPDLFAASEPMPTAEGEYEATLYGVEVVAVLALTHGRNWLAGRVAAVVYDEDDAAADRAWKHAHSPEDWR